MTKTIEIIVTPKGETTLTTKVFVGGECREASKFSEEALGQRSSEQLTSEFHQSQESNQRNEQQN